MIRDDSEDLLSSLAQLHGSLLHSLEKKIEKRKKENREKDKPKVGKKRKF